MIVAAERCELRFKRLLQDPQLLLIRLPSGCEPESERQTLPRGRASFADGPFRQLPRRSTNMGSFSSVKACSGVLVVERLTMQNSRSGASNSVIVGCGAVRFQNV